MLQPVYSGQFKRDVRLAKRRGKQMSKLKTVVDLLLEGKKLPHYCHVHPLRGEYEGFTDAHIEFDWILVYKILEKHVRFERTGRHNDVFKKY